MLKINGLLKLISSVRIWMVLYLMSLRMTLFQGCFSVAVCIVAMLCSVRLFVLQCYT